jgi:hypothetical protein
MLVQILRPDLIVNMQGCKRELELGNKDGLSAGNNGLSAGNMDGFYAGNQDGLSAGSLRRWPT